MYKIAKFFKTEQRVSQLYGARPDYYKQFGFNGHEGVDYATTVGTELRSPFDGIILRDTDDAKADAYGKKVVVWDPVQKIAFWFCHLDYNTVVDGQKVKEGDILGFTGNTGNSTGPHCHVNFCETGAGGSRLNTTNGYKGFLDFTKYCEFVTPTAPPTTVNTNIDFGGFITPMETYGIISLETLKSKLLAKDNFIKSHQPIFEPSPEPEIIPESPVSPQNDQEVPSAPPQATTPPTPPENSFDVLFSALLTWLKKLFGKSNG